VILPGIVCLGGLFASEPGIDEAEFFRDSLPPVASPNSASVTDSGIKVSFSGDAIAVAQVGWRERSLDTSGSDAGFSMVVDGSVQARLSTGSRASVMVEANHDATHDTTTFYLREAFLDGNLLGYAWIRAGKQVLQWGRGILWTPTDLVNVEGKTLVPRAGAKEGATGVRLQVPLGTRANAYVFTDLSGVQASDSLAVAWRLETTAGPTEIAASGWHKQDAPTALGLDGSAGLLGWDLQAGAMWLSGDLVSRPRLQDGNWSSYRDDDRSQVRAGGGIGRGFAVLGQPDRLRLDIEGFWQSDAIGTDLFTATGRAPAAIPAALLRLAPAAAGATVVQSGLEYMAFNGMYKPNQMGSAYVAAMVSVSRFLHQDLTLTGQGLTNIDDKSGLATLALSWRTFHGVSAQVNGYWFWGDPGTEMALSGVGPALETRLGISF
jgi:hypothetical protein